MFSIKAAGIGLCCMLILFSSGARAQNSGQQNYIPVSRELFDSIAHMDSVLFHAFNKRDTATFKSLFTTDLEFYHDKGGLTGYQHTVDFMRSVTVNKSDLRRDLVPESLEVYPIGDYGAVQIGSHRFCHSENGKQDCGTFKFIHIWKRIRGEWKISRVISYDH